MAPAIFLPFAMALVGPYPTPKIMSALVGPSSASTPSVSMILKNERKTLTDRRPPPSWAPLKPIKNLFQRKLNKKLSVQDAILTANIRAMDERARASVTVRRDLAEDAWERMLPSRRRLTRDLAEDSWERLLPSMTSFDTFRRDLAEKYLRIEGVVQHHGAADAQPAHRHPADAGHVDKRERIEHHVAIP